MKGDPEIVFIQQTIDLTLLYMEKKIEGFNANNYKSYIGLSEDASLLFKKTMEKLYKTDNVEIIHGEIKHNWRVKSSEWDRKHVWCKYSDYYIDITISQFLPIIKDVPQIYVSKKKPKWFTESNNKFKDTKTWASICDALHSILYKEK